MKRIKSIGDVVFEYGSLFVQEQFSPKSKVVEVYLAADNSRIAYSAPLLNPPLTLDSKSYSWVTDEQRISILASYEADEALEVVFTDNFTATAKFALETPPTFQELSEGSCLYVGTIPMYYTSIPIPPPPQAKFLLKVHSSTAPLVTAVGGTLITTNNGNGTWYVSGATGITKVSFDIDGSYNTLSPNVTKVECISADSLTSLELFCCGMSITEITFGAGFDTSAVTSLYAAFYGCAGLTSLPLLDTSSVTDFSYTLSNCTNLASIPLFNTSSVTTFSYAFHLCPALTSFPLLNTSIATDFSGAFSMCAGLTSLPLLDTSSVTDFSYIFDGCTNLTYLNGIDTRAQTDTTGMFDNTPALLRPDATEQTTILAGALWVNDTPC